MIKGWRAPFCSPFIVSAAQAVSKGVDYNEMQTQPQSFLWAPSDLITTLPLRRLAIFWPHLAHITDSHFLQICHFYKALNVPTEG